MIPRQSAKHNLIAIKRFSGLISERPKREELASRSNTPVLLSVPKPPEYQVDSIIPSGVRCAFWMTVEAKYPAATKFSLEIGSLSEIVPTIDSATAPIFKTGTREWVDCSYIKMQPF